MTVEANSIPAIHQRSDGVDRFLTGVLCVLATMDDYWFTPLARKPPSTTNRWPVTKLAASEARNITAPTSSSSSPNLRIGVRTRSSSPRGVPCNRGAVRSVRKYPGARALTHTPWRAHSMASDLVSEATAALLAL